MSCCGLRPPPTPPDARSVLRNLCFVFFFLLILTDDDSCHSERLQLLQENPQPNADQQLTGTCKRTNFSFFPSRAAKNRGNFSEPLQPLGASFFFALTAVIGSDCSYQLVFSCCLCPEPTSDAPQEAFHHRGIEPAEIPTRVTPQFARFLEKKQNKRRRSGINGDNKTQAGCERRR